MFDKPIFYCEYFKVFVRDSPVMNVTNCFAMWRFQIMFSIIRVGFSVLRFGG